MVLGTNCPTCLPLVSKYGPTKLHFAWNIVGFIRLSTLQQRETCWTLNRQNISLSQSVSTYGILSFPGNTSESWVARLPWSSSRNASLWSHFQEQGLLLHGSSIIPREKKAFPPHTDFPDTACSFLQVCGASTAVGSCLLCHPPWNLWCRRRVNTAREFVVWQYHFRYHFSPSSNSEFREYISPLLR